MKLTVGDDVVLTAAALEMVCHPLLQDKVIYRIVDCRLCGGEYRFIIADVGALVAQRVEMWAEDLRKVAA